MHEMKVKAIVPWFGSKRTMAPEIVVELGKHGQFFEPFCGSMAVLFAKEPSQKETVNDLHGDLIHLARVIRNETSAEMLYDRLQRVVQSEDLLECARQYLTDTDGDLKRLLEQPDPDAYSVERAYWYFLASWMGRNGTAGTQRLDYQIAVRWTKGGGSPTVRFRNAVESLPAWHVRLQNVVILKRNAFEIIDRFEDVKETAIYVDPPYVADSRAGFRFGPGSDHKYVHEFTHRQNGGRGLFVEEADDHERLRDILAGYKHARIVVSYYDCPRVRELYRGWTFVDHSRQKHLHAQNGRGARPKEAPEVLIINGPSYASVA